MIRRHRDSLAAESAGWKRIVTPLLLLGVASYILGVLVPYVRMDFLGAVTIEKASFLEVIIDALLAGDVLTALFMLAWIVFVGWQVCLLLTLWRYRSADELPNDWQFKIIAVSPEPVTPSKLLAAFWIVAINLGILAVVFGSTSFVTIGVEPGTLFLLACLATIVVGGYAVTDSVQSRHKHFKSRPTLD